MSFQNQNCSKSNSNPRSFNKDHSELSMASKMTPWSQVLSGFLLMFNSWGLINAFGVFQEYYSTLDPPLASQSAISWIGSLPILLLLLFGSASGSFVDRGLAQRMVFLGTILLTLAVLFTSFSGEFTSAKRPIFYQILLSQGALSGLGMSLLLVPSTAIIPTYFTEYRAFAVGLANSGASVGGIIYPILTRRLLRVIGFSWAMRTYALVILVTTGLGGLLVRQRRDLTQNPKKRTLYDLGCLRERSYGLFVAGVFFAFAGSFIPYFYIATWARNTRFPLDGLEAYYLLSILNVGGLAGRILPSFIADKLKISPMLVQSIAAIACGALAVGWTYIKSSLPSLIVWSIFYGFFSGSIISLIPASAATLTQEMSRLGGRLGVVFAFNAIATLIGNPVAGLFLKTAGSGWLHLALYCATLNFAGGMFLAIGWYLKIVDGRHNE